MGAENQKANVKLSTLTLKACFMQDEVEDAFAECSNILYPTLPQWEAHKIIDKYQSIVLKLVENQLKNEPVIIIRMHLNRSEKTVKFEIWSERTKQYIDMKYIDTKELKIIGVNDDFETMDRRCNGILSHGMGTKQ